MVSHLRAQHQRDGDDVAPAAGRKSQPTTPGLYQRSVPVPSTANEPGSVQIGQAVKGGQAIPVALSPLAVRHNTLILGKTQKGKTTVEGVLAQSIMAQRDHALVVTLAPALQVQVSRKAARRWTCGTHLAHPRAREHSRYQAHGC